VVLRVVLTASLLLASSCAESAPAAEEACAPQPGVEELLSGSLIPGPDEEKLRREHARAGELARTLSRLPGVEDARVHLSLADRSLLSRDPEAESRAAVVLRFSGRGDPPAADQVRAIAAAAIGGLEAEQVEVFATGIGSAGEETVRVGPIEVAAGSAGTARAVLGGLLGVCLLLAAGLIYAGWRLRRMRG
jgi:type III secretory pathway lipoprotein EscJ